MTASLLGILFIVGIVAAGASLLASFGRYGAAALTLPEQLRSCRIRDDMRFRVRVPINTLASKGPVPLSDRAAFRTRPAWPVAA
ncbi:MAG: hypothetical protein ABIT04_05270 [Novosphingobium sp.]